MKKHRHNSTLVFINFQKINSLIPGILCCLLLLTSIEASSKIKDENKLGLELGTEKLRNGKKLLSVDVSIRGQITDTAGVAIPGAVVRVKGTQIAGVTDENGQYSLKAPEGSNTLVISFIGFETKEVNTNGREVVNVTLQVAGNALSDVVIVGYGQQKRESVVGAISTVKVAELKTAAPRSLNNALIGKVAGIIAVQRSGEPGYDDAQFWIRGISTFGGGNNPLILVDGIERPLNNIEPEEIETFSVLKDAAATSIYGVRGANGVILVNTRRGANSKPTISFKLESGRSAATRLPDFVDAPTYLNLFNEARLATNPNFVTTYTPEVIAKYASGEDPYLYPNVDWIDLMMKDHSNQSRANLNISGGGDIAKYFVSASYYNENGIWKGDNLNTYNTNAGLKRYNFRANTDLKLSKRTELSLGLGGILVTANYPGSSAGQIWADGGIMFNTPVGYAPSYPNPNNDGVLYGGLNGIDNPYELLTGRGFDTEWRNNIQSDITLRQDLSGFVKGLKVQGKFAFDGYNSHNISRKRQASKYSVSGRDPMTDELLLSPLFVGQKDLGFGRTSGGNRRIYVQANIDYSRTIGNHEVTGLLLYNQQDYQDGAAGTAMASLPFRLQGVVGRVAYNYKRKYYTELSAGYNGSENFEKGKRFGLFPAVAAGWIVSEEPFFKNNVGFMEYLKLRGSIGEKGNDQIGGRRFAYLTTVGNGNGGYKFGMDNNNDVGSRGEDQWGSDLTWETETELNLGLEMRFLKGFYFQGDFFNRHRKDIYLQRNSLPAIIGLQNTPYGNLGEYKNRGVDGSLEYRRRLNKLDVTLRGNLTYARNQIVDQDQPDYLYTYQNRQGKRLGQPFGLIADGLFRDESEIASSATQGFGAVRPGDIKYKDINGDGAIDAFDQVAIGNPSTPEVVYGFGTTLGYKGFDVSVFFQGADNMTFQLGGMGFFPFTEEGFRGSVSKYALDRWTPDNPRQDALFPRLSYGTSNLNNIQASTWWQRDASYLRLKTAELGYTIPKQFTRKLNVNTFRVYASGFNLLTWSKFKFWDPELGSGNGGRYPIQRSVFLGLNMNF
ncbi:MAG: TonB-dependent receptor [Sphingobacteriaceae bacterium]|nr:TonB-dependent receptor [Sphingobacteriaceae bacterium]